MATMKKLFIFTAQYPLGIGEEFITSEIPILQQYFDIIIVPFNSPNSYNNRDYALKLNRSLIDIFSKKSWKLKAMLSLLQVQLYRELKNEIQVNNIFGFNELKRAIGHFYQAKITAKLINSILTQNKTEHIIFYNYWLDFTVFAFLFVKHKNYNVISRAHGYEIYPEQNKNDYIPFQLRKINILDILFTASDAGKKYLLGKYGKAIKPSIVSSTLGINKLFKSCDYSNSDVLKIVSVSYCVDIKRINLIIDLINALHLENLKIEWHHIGDGVLLENLQKYAKKMLHCKYIFWGYKTNKEVQYMLSSMGYNVFISCTYSEGGNPVSMQEAQAYSLPIIATNVGGVSEVLENYDCGWLLDRDFDVKKIALILKNDLTNPSLLKLKSDNAYKSYLEKFQAKKNYALFAKQLLEIMPCVE